MQFNQYRYSGFNPQTPSLLDVQFKIRDKEQFKQIMLEIYNNSMFHGKILFIIAIISFIAMFVTAKFAYYTNIGQYVLVALSISGLLGLSLAIGYYIPSTIFKKQIEKSYAEVSFTTPFIYHFYQEGIEMNTPIMKGIFSWEDIAFITIDPQCAAFSFSKQTKNGRRIAKIKEYYGGVIIPLACLNEETKQQLIDITKAFYKQRAIKNLRINKKLR